MSHKIFCLKPEPTERAKRIFQEACSVENMEAKLGRTLSEDENRVKRFILIQTPILGRIPFIDKIRKEFDEFQMEKVDAILNKLDQVDAIHLDNDKATIAAAYPFSGSETSHQVFLKRKGFKVYAMCAIDALGVSFMFDCDVSVDSLCFHCGDRIEIEVKNNEIVTLNPRRTVVWCDMEYSECAATSLCKNINFFSSEDHYKKWQRRKPKTKGYLLQIDEAFYLGKLFFEKRIR